MVGGMPGRFQGLEFRWNDWNIDKVEKHGVAPEEAELVVGNASRPYPEAIEDSKFLVWGRGSGGRHLQVVFIISPEYTIFVIHARPLTDAEKRRLQKKRK